MGLLDYKGREAKLLLTECEMRIAGERREERVAPDPTSVHKHNRKHLIKEKKIERIVRIAYSRSGKF